MNKNFSFYYNIFILFISFLLIEGIYSAYYYKLSSIIDYLPFESKSSINIYIWNENGLVEILQSFFLFCSIFFIFRYINFQNFKRRSIFFNFFIYLYFIGLIYYSFEEISWGQHIFFWSYAKQNH